MRLNEIDPVRRRYAHLAERYDRRWARYVTKTASATLCRLDLRPTERLLDVGSGTGTLMQRAAHTRPEAVIAGVDLSPDMLHAARRKLDPHIGLFNAAAERLPFEDRAFDAAVSISVLHFWRCPRKSLTVIARVLRPGGRLVITDWCGDYLTCRTLDRTLRHCDPAHYAVSDSAKLRRTLQATGFHVLKLERYRISWFWGLMTATARRFGAMASHPPNDGGIA